MITSVDECSAMSKDDVRELIEYARQKAKTSRPLLSFAKSPNPEIGIIEITNETPIREYRMTTIFAGKSKRDQIPVELKCLNPSFARKAEVRNEFERIWKVEAVTSPHFRIVDSGSAPPPVPIVWIATRTDGTYLKDLPGFPTVFSTEDTLKAVLGLCQCVAELHRKKITHNAISVSTVFMVEGKPYLSEPRPSWSFLKSQGCLAESEFNDSISRFAAPEVESSPGSVAGDIYSIGALLAEGLAQRINPTFDRYDYPTYEAYFSEIWGLIQNALRFTTRRAELQPSMRAMLAKCLAEAPSDRFKSVDELILALQRLLQNLKAMPTAAVPKLNDGPIAGVVTPPDTAGPFASRVSAIVNEIFELLDGQNVDERLRGKR